MTTSTGNPDNEIVIVGAGPTGLVAALALTQGGIPVRILERQPTLSTESRASTFHPSSMHIFERLSFIDDLHRGAVVVPRVQFRDRQKGPFATLDYSVIEDQTAYPYRLQIEQSKVTSRLAERLTAAGVEVEFNNEVVQVHVDDSGQSVVTTSSPEGVRELQARFVIGADGAASIVRRTIGRAFTGLTYPERYLVVSSEFPFEEALDDIELVNYISDPQEWLAILRTPDHWRVTFPLGPEVDDQAVQAPTELRRRLRQVTGTDADYTHSNIYRVHRRVASSFSRGTTFLVGDAAHVNNPLGGLGMNSGVLDAYFLSQRILGHLLDGKPYSHVEAYAAIHRDLALNVVGKQTNYNWVSLRESDEEARAAQQRELAAVVADPDRAKEHVRGSALLSALDGLDTSLQTQEA